MKIQIAMIPAMAAAFSGVFSTCSLTETCTKVAAAPPAVAPSKPCPPCPAAPMMRSDTTRVVPAPEGVFKNIHFDDNQYYLTPVAESQLSMLARYLNENSSIRILIAGNCGTFGTETYNKELGAKRALAVKDFLVSKVA